MVLDVEVYPNIPRDWSNAVPEGNDLVHQQEEFESDQPTPESSSSSFSEQATLAQFAPPGKFHVPNESVVGDVTVPGTYLHSTFVVHSGSSEYDVWIADSDVSCHMTHDRSRI